MNKTDFLARLQKHLVDFERAISTDEKEWIIKGFIDIYKNIYTISIDTKIVSKVFELLLFPLLKSFGDNNDLQVELSPQQNFYPDITFIDSDGNKFAVDIKSTYRIDEKNVNGMTLGAFTGYFRNRTSSKNTLYPYGSYSGHFVLGIIYSKSNDFTDERKVYSLEDLEKIPSVINNFQFFAWDKYRIAGSRPGSGNTKNIGSVLKLKELIEGTGPFYELSEEVYDDYWMYYLTVDMAKALEIKRPYTNLKTYFSYKQTGNVLLKEHEQLILDLDEPDAEVENIDED